MKNKLSPEDAELLSEEDDDEGSWQKQVILDRRAAKSLKKDLSLRPERRYIGNGVKKKTQFRD